MILLLHLSSERVSKTGVTGSLLNEAKYINVSLHFLEQVSVLQGFEIIYINKVSNAHYMVFKLL